jgi:hypothetical protein
MGYHDSGIHVEHHRLAEITIGDPWGRNTVRQQGPHVSTHPWQILANGRHDGLCVGRFCWRSPIQ